MAVRLSALGYADRTATSITPRLDIEYAEDIRDGDLFAWVPLAFLEEAAGDLIYRGEALPGSEVGAPAWRIWRVSAGGNVVEWADGDGDFDNVWDDRALLTYE